LAESDDKKWQLNNHPYRETSPLLSASSIERGDKAFFTAFELLNPLRIINEQDCG
jgi:hypothetical protein